MTDLSIYGEDHLSNFEGDMDIYTGENDDFLNFAGASSFADENNAKRVYQMTLTNGSSADVDVAVIPSYATAIKAVNDVAKTGTIKTDVTGVGSPVTIDEFLAYIKSVPSNLLGMRLSSTKSSQMQKIITIKNHSPFRTLESQQIFLGARKDENAFQDDILTIETPGVVLGPETEMTIPVVANSTLTISFFVGGVLSTSSALYFKTAKAVHNLRKIGYAPNHRRLR